jgi:dTDP-4-dehydrorhamnose reductase
LNPQTVLVTGATGLLGPYLVEAASEFGTVVASGRRDGDHVCDLTRAKDVQDLVSKVRPDVVIHAAGMTDVEECERRAGEADALNHRSVIYLNAALQKDAKLILISTDQVYPDTPGLHREGSEAPVNVYGCSKLKGERAVATRAGSLALRTNLFGPSRTKGRQSLSDWLKTSLEQSKNVTLFRDVLFSPLHMSTLSHYVVECLHAGMTGGLNLGCRNGASKADFGIAVARQLDLPTDHVRLGDSSELDGRAPRPKDLRMDVESLETSLGITMPSLEQEIAKL